MENLKNANKIKEKKPTAKIIKKDKVNNNRFRIKSKLTIIIPIIAIVVIAVVVFLVYMFIDSFKYKPYIQYESAIDMYSFSKTYNNQKSKTSNSITKSESIKMVLSAVYNESDISGFAKEPADKYENAIWVDFAKFKGIIGDSEITAENENDKAKYIDVIRYFANAKIKVLDKTLDVNIDSKPKDFESYKQEEQQAIADMINNKIIVENVNNLKAEKNIFKGQLNELIVKFVEKYNTITLNGEKLNINQEKMPKNINDYPYTLSSVEKEIYEMPFVKKESDKFKNPKEVFSQDKATFEQIKYVVETYYNTILNIDYNNISKEGLYSSLEKVTVNPPDKSEIEQYVEYVKKNKIMIEGKPTVYMPIVYFDGLYYRARVKLDFEIKYSDTKNNVLYKDLQYNGYTPATNVDYSESKYSTYIDTVLSKQTESKSIYIFENPVYDCYVTKVNTPIKLSLKGGE